MIAQASRTVAGRYAELVDAGFLVDILMLHFIDADSGNRIAHATYPATEIDWALDYHRDAQVEEMSFSVCGDDDGIDLSHIIAEMYVLHNA